MKRKTKKHYPKIVLVVFLMVMGCAKQNTDLPGTITTTKPEVSPSPTLPNQGITIFIWKNKDGQFVGNYLEGIESKLEYDIKNKEEYSETFEQMKDMMVSQQSDMLYYFKGLEKVLSESQNQDLRSKLDLIGGGLKVYEGDLAKRKQELFGKAETIWTVLVWQKPDLEWMFWSFYGLEYAFDAAQLASVKTLEFDLKEVKEIILAYGNVNIYVRGFDKPLSNEEVDIISKELVDTGMDIVYEGRQNY